MWEPLAPRETKVQSRDQKTSALRKQLRVTALTQFTHGLSPHSEGELTHGHP